MNQKLDFYLFDTYQIIIINLNVNNESFILGNDRKMLWVQSKVVIISILYKYLNHIMKKIILVKFNRQKI